MTDKLEQQATKTPTDVNAWRSVGANLFRRGYRLDLYLTRNPKMDVHIQAGYDAAKSGTRIRIAVTGDDDDIDEDNPLELPSNAPARRVAKITTKRQRLKKQPAPFTTDLFGESLVKAAKKPKRSRRRGW